MTASSDPGFLVVDLDDEKALDGSIAGAKAAWLAAGRRAGLPVLPGLVVVAPASAAAFAIGLSGLRSGGSGQARMMVVGAGIPPRLEEALRSRIPWSRLAVRSSSPLEGSGEWAGAFGSYLDVGTGDLARTISGCWASSFSVAALQRFERMGLQPLPMAVLIQPFVSARAGGTAAMREEVVTIESVAGSPAGLLAGHIRGRRSEVDLRTGAVDGFAEQHALEVARLAALARERIGATYLEWAAAGEGIAVLQLARPERPLAEQAPSVVLSPDPELTRLARVVRRFPGPLGTALVLPWAVALDDPTALDEVMPVAASSIEAALDKARAVASNLTRQVWQSPIGEDLARAALADLAGDPAQVLPLVARLAPVDLDLGSRVVGLVRGVGRLLHQRARIGHPEEVWLLGEPQLRTGAGTIPLKFGADRWEPLGAAVTEANGRRRVGVPASDGVGLGRVAVVASPGEVGLGPRQVIIAPEPIPHLAPLLWGAAGLVTLGGSPAAHLFESARSLGVPAVAGADLDLGVLASGSWAAAVDGTRGTVALTEW